LKSNSKIKVLIIDDQPLVLDILSKGLVRDPMIEVIGTATDGQIGLNLINRTKPDVIVLDLEMPKMNGIDFLHKLNSINPIPTIVLSALTDKDSKLTRDAFEAGAVDFIKKPSGGSQGLLDVISQLWIKIKIAVNEDVNYLKTNSENYEFPPTTLDRQTKTDTVILGMRAMDFSSDFNKTIKIYALGSCVCLALFCPTNNVYGLSHIALPYSSTNLEKAEELPGYFCDTAPTEMLKIMMSKGCKRNEIIAKIAGGAKTRAEIGDYFNIGQRNVIALKANLLKNNIELVAQDVGGDISRTVYINPNDTNLYIHHPTNGTWKI
jgi:chemotaxis receptor (MCP) glutamine deamidase CheD/CheY-like chemotaxis protein